MWLAQFVCALQFFTTPKGLCGQTVELFLLFLGLHKFEYITYALKRKKQVQVILSLRLSTIAKCRWNSSVSTGLWGYMGPRCCVKAVAKRKNPSSDKNNDLHAATLFTEPQEYKSDFNCLQLLWNSSYNEKSYGVLWDTAVQVGVPPRREREALNLDNRSDINEAQMW
jgi:hypothetical protein